MSIHGFEDDLFSLIYSKVQDIMLSIQISYLFHFRDVYRLVEFLMCKGFWRVRMSIRNVVLATEQPWCTDPQGTVRERSVSARSSLVGVYSNRSCRLGYERITMYTDLHAQCNWTAANQTNQSCVGSNA
jgi:hypothetical protein